MIFKNKLLDTFKGNLSTIIAMPSFLQFFPIRKPLELIYDLIDLMNRSSEPIKLGNVPFWIHCFTI